MGNIHNATVLASTVVQAALTSSLRERCLPFDSAQQVEDLRRSPFLNTIEREELLRLFVPSGNAAAALQPGMMGHFGDEDDEPIQRPPSPYSPRPQSPQSPHSWSPWRPDPAWQPDADDLYFDAQKRAKLDRAAERF